MGLALNSTEIRVLGNETLTLNLATKSICEARAENKEAVHVPVQSATYTDGLQGSALSSHSKDALLRHILLC